MAGPAPTEHPVQTSHHPKFINRISQYVNQIHAAHTWLPLTCDIAIESNLLRSHRQELVFKEHNSPRAIIGLQHSPLQRSVLSIDKCWNSGAGSIGATLCPSLTFSKFNKPILQMPCLHALRQRKTRLPHLTIQYFCRINVRWKKIQRQR
jgi:hypothetical protein